MSWISGEITGPDGRTVLLGARLAGPALNATMTPSPTDYGGGGGIPTSTTPTTTAPKPAPKPTCKVGYVATPTRTAAVPGSIGSTLKTIVTGWSCLKAPIPRCQPGQTMVWSAANSRWVCTTPTPAPKPSCPVGTTPVLQASGAWLCAKPTTLPQTYNTQCPAGTNYVVPIIGPGVCMPTGSTPVKPPSLPIPGQPIPGSQLPSPPIKPPSSPVPGSQIPTQPPVQAGLPIPPPDETSMTTSAEGAIHFGLPKWLKVGLALAVVGGVAYGVSRSRR